jgi:hypothetical protein
MKILMMKVCDCFINDMLYQLSIYALSQEPGPKSEAAILYPTLSSSAREAKIFINDPLTMLPRGAVILRPVNLDTLSDLIDKRGSVGSDSKATEYVKQLVLGLNESAVLT